MVPAQRVEVSVLTWNRVDLDGARHDVLGFDLFFISSAEKNMGCGRCGKPRPLRFSMPSTPSFAAGREGQVIA